MGPIGKESLEENSWCCTWVLTLVNLQMKAAQSGCSLLELPILIYGLIPWLESDQGML